MKWNDNQKSHHHKDAFTNTSSLAILQECTKVNDTLMKCPVPDVRDFLKISRRRREVPKYEMGFKMDDVKEVTNMGKEMPWVDAMVSLYPDPVIMNFTDFHEIYTGGALVLEVRHEIIIPKYLHTVYKHTIMYTYMHAPKNM